MADKLLIQDGKAVLKTEEGQIFLESESDVVDMLRREILPPLDGAALPDGLKFFEWRPPFLVVVHQLPAHVRQLRWIDNDSPMRFGPGTRYRKVRISLPYTITFAVYFQRGTGLGLTGCNELYFRNQPMRHRTDRLGYPALLNISPIKTPSRTRSWICTQHLSCPPPGDWTAQLGALLDHTWNGSFNLSSEHHEGASFYGESRGIHKALHPIEKWEQATAADEVFAMSVPWKEVPMNVGELINAILDECHQSARLRLVDRVLPQPSSMVQRFLNFVQSANGKKKTA